MTMPMALALSGQDGRSLAVGGLIHDKAVIDSGLSQDVSHQIGKQPLNLPLHLFEVVNHIGANGNADLAGRNLVGIGLASHAWQPFFVSHPLWLHCIQLTPSGWSVQPLRRFSHLKLKLNIAENHATRNPDRLKFAGE